MSRSLKRTYSKIRKRCSKTLRVHPATSSSRADFADDQLRFPHLLLMGRTRTATLTEAMAGQNLLLLLGHFKLGKLSGKHQNYLQM